MTEASRLMLSVERDYAIPFRQWLKSFASPYYTLLEEGADGRVQLSKPADPPFVRRQDAPRCWEINGALYVFDRTRHAADPRVLYSDTRLCEMPPERSVDIDTEWDWRVVEGVWGG